MDLFRVMGSDYTRYDTSKADHTSLLTRQRTPWPSWNNTAHSHHSRGFVQAIDFPKRSYEMTVEADPEADFEDPGCGYLYGMGPF